MVYCEKRYNFSFSVFVSLIGILGGKCKNTCLLVTHVSFGVICIIGFAATCIISGMWLGGEQLIGDWMNNEINITQFKSVCSNETLVSEIENLGENDTADLLEGKAVLQKTYKAFWMGNWMFCVEQKKHF